MLQFPKNTLVNIPDSLNLAGDCLVSVRIEDPETSIEAIKEIFGRRLNSITINPDVLPQLTTFSDFAGVHLRIHAGDSHMAIVGEHVGSLRKCAAMFILAPDGNLVRRLNFLTGFRFVTHIDPLAGPVDENVLMDALGFYLHNPILQTPIEPFHHLLQTMSSGRGMTLPDLEFERPLRHFYIDGDGRISLSERYHRAGLILGSLEDTWEDLASGAGMKRVLSLSDRVFEEQTACMLCSHYSLCGALFKAIDPEAACDSWQRVFDMLESERRTADELLRGHGAPGVH